MSVNKVILVGFLGDDPVKVQLNTGIVANFSLATSEKWKDKEGNKQESTEWHRCKAFGPLADVICTYLKKGSQIYIEGKIKTSSYEKDGQKRYSTDIIVREMQMLGSKQSYPIDEFLPNNSFE